MDKKGSFEKKVEQAFEVPAKVLEGGIALAKREEKSFISKRPFRFMEEYWDTLGPGLTAGAADDDPSGIATYSQGGALYGLQLIWLALYSYPFMVVVQEMCARIGMVTGHGLAASIREHYSKYILYIVTFFLFFANTLNIAADLGAMAAASRLLYPQAGAALLVIVFALASLLLQVFTTYARYAKFLKYLTLSLLSYIAVAFVVHLNWADVLYRTVVPSITFSRDQFFIIAAVLGTTISPYLFFWQTSQEVEEEERHERASVAAHPSLPPVTKRSLRHMRADVWSGMAFSNLIAFFIIAACAGTLHAHGVTNIATAEQAALALRPFGELAYVIFTLGIVGTGFLAVPVLAGSTAYALAESFEWKYGLYRKLKEAYAFYGVIIVSMVVGIIANLMHLDPIRGLIYAAVANGIVAPFILFFIIRLSGDKGVMGKHANRPLTKIIGWATFIIMTVASVAALLSF